MSVSPVREFYLPENDNVETLLGRAQGSPWELSCDPVKKVLRTYHDTFDWRLHQAGFVLAGEGSGSLDLTVLYRIGTGERYLHLPTPPKPFAGDYPLGPMRDLLVETVWIRQLLPTAEVRLEVAPCRIVDRRGKTLVRVSLLRGEVVKPGGGVSHPFRPRLRIEGVRGYKAAMRRVLLELDQHQFPEVGMDIYDEVLDILAHSPGGYRPKPVLQLDPDLSAEKAMRDILLHLLDVMETNRQGTIDNLDSEFLHDFRVAVRRTRSALAQVKKVFSAKDIRAFRDEFKWLGALTGPTRDLDVYLLKFPFYRESLPDDAKDDLDPFLRFLQDHHHSEQKKLAKALASKRVDQLFSEWRRYLEQNPGDHPDSYLAGAPILEVARRRNWKLYRLFVNEGRAIGADSPDSQIHQLRITGKKLRYLLEFFSTLFPAEKIGKLIKATKTLQDFLGDFNDLAVQQEKLREFSMQMQAEHARPAATLVAMGRLVEDMARRQRDMRNEFPRHFADFDRGRLRDLFENLFAGAEKKTS